MERKRQTLTCSHASVSKKQPKDLSQLQRSFCNHWPSVEPKRVYDALNDSHTNSYFRARSVRNRLKEYRKSLEQGELNKKEKERLQKLIVEKKKQAKRWESKGKQIYDSNQSVSQTMRLKKIQAWSPKNSNETHRSKDKSINPEALHEKDQAKDKKKQEEVVQQRRRSDYLFERMHAQKREDWLYFLKSKREELTSS